MQAKGPLGGINGNACFWVEALFVEFVAATLVVHQRTFGAVGFDGKGGVAGGKAGFGNPNGPIGVAQRDCGVVFEGSSGMPAITGTDAGGTS